MTKLSLLASAFVFFFVLPHSLDAQVYFGIKGGFTAANLNSESGFASNTSSRSGMHAGALVQLKVRVISLQAEVLYSQQGASEEGSDVMYKNDYIIMPIVVKLTLGPMNIHTGIQYDMLLSADYGGNDNKDYYQNGFSVPIGAGLDVRKFQLEARFIAGLTDIGNNPDITGKLTNTVFQISFGYKFGRF